MGLERMYQFLTSNRPGGSLKKSEGGRNNIGSVSAECRPDFGMARLPAFRSDLTGNGLAGLGAPGESGRSWGQDDLILCAHQHLLSTRLHPPGCPLRPTTGFLNS